jgi:hypothetical protein
MTDAGGSSSDLPLPVIACELTALTEEERRRRQTLAESLFASVVEVEDLAAGYAFYFDRRPATEREVGELVALERLCCPILGLSSRIDGESGRLVLEITGGQGVRAFIAAQFGVQGGLTPKEAP